MVGTGGAHNKYGSVGMGAGHTPRLPTGRTPRAKALGALSVERSKLTTAINLLSSNAGSDTDEAALRMILGIARRIQKIEEDFNGA